MTTTPTDPTVEMLVNGVWVDITADCRLANADSGGDIEIKRGRPNEGNAAEPTEFNFVLNNGASRVTATLGQSSCYSPRNPLGPYYGHLGRNQQVRIGINKRTDNFTRTVVDGWGSMPSKIQADGVTVAPVIPWRIVSPAGLFDMNGTEATINAAAAASTTLVSLGTPVGDTDVTIRVKASARDTEFGIMARFKKTFIDPAPGIDGTFETGVVGWQSSNGTVTQNTVPGVPHSGNACGQLTVTGGPATASFVTSTAQMWGGALKPGGTYRLRVWVKTSITTTVIANISYYNEALVFQGTIASAPIATTAGVWTLLEISGAAPQDAAWARPGPILQGTPAAGTTMMVDDLEFYDQNAPTWYSVNFVPGGTDIVKFGKVSPGTSRSISTNWNQQLLVNTYYKMRIQVTGQRLRMKMWKDSDPEPATWYHRYFDDVTVKESPVGAVGEVGLFTGTGTALVTFDSFTINQWRAHAEIAELPPRWDISRSDRWVPIAARGQLRRLGQGRKALRSAVSLYLQSYSALSYGWWPLEDDTGDNAGNNAPRGLPAVISGLEFASSDLTGALALPGVSGFATLAADTSTFIATVAKHTVVGGKESILFFMKLPSSPASTIKLCSIYTLGTVRTWNMYMQSGSFLQVDGLNSTGTIITTDTRPFYFLPDHPQGCWIACTLTLNQVGGNFDWALNYHHPGQTSFFTCNASGVAGTVGAISGATFRGSAGLTAAGGLSITQVMQYAGDLPFVDYDFESAANAYLLETATARFIRIATNANINVTTSGVGTTPMGFQLPSKVLDILEDCAAVEDGIIEEERGDSGLTLRTRSSMWNGVKHTLDIDAGHLSAPLDPNDDDQGTRNDVTVNRANGSFSRSVQETGPLNTQLPEDDPDGVGVYDEAPTINVGTDAMTQSVADWRRSKGTQDVPRYPSIHADISATAYQASPALAAETLSIDSGDVILLDNPEVDADPSIQLVQSYTEQIGIFDHDITWVAAPAEVNEVGVVNFTTRIDTESQFTNGAFLSGTDTKLLSILSGAGLPWGTILSQETAFPFDIDVSGVRLRVLACGDVLNSNPSFETDILGWVATSANVTFAFDRFAPARGLKSVRVQAVAAGTDGIVQDPAFSSVTVAATDYLLSGWIKTEAAATDLRLAVDWYQSNNTTFISTALPTSIVTTANAWTWYSAVVTSPALAARGRLKIRNVFAGATRMWADELRIMPVASYTGNPQTLTVQQAPVNGIIKAIPVNSPIRLAAPWRVAW